MVIVTPKNVQFEDVSFFIKASDEKSSYSFNAVKFKVNEHWCLIGMPDAGMRINDNFDPNWASVVCKWSVTITPRAITICSFPYIGKSKELSYVRKTSTWGEKGFKSCTKPISIANTTYCNNGNGYFSPLRYHKIINTWSILTNEVSKLLWLNILSYAVFTFWTMINSFNTIGG